MQPLPSRLVGTTICITMMLAGSAMAQIPPPPLSPNNPGVEPVLTGPVPPPPFMQGMVGQEAAPVSGFMAPQGMAGAQDVGAPLTGANAGADAASNPPSTQATEATSPSAASVAEPATAPAPAAKADGTAPGNDGWTGGTGGSNIDTNPQGAVATSKTWQPPTARGLDLMGAADLVAKQ